MIGILVSLLFKLTLCELSLRSILFRLLYQKEEFFLRAVAHIYHMKDVLDVLQIKIYKASITINSR